MTTTVLIVNDDNDHNDNDDNNNNNTNDRHDIKIIIIIPITIRIKLTYFRSLLIWSQIQVGSLIYAIP